MAYVSGSQTFTAYTDLAINRIVRLVTGSATTPREVQYAATAAKDMLGVTLTSAKAGDLITVKPFNSEGSYEIETNGNIGNGNYVYGTSTGGYINDELTDLYIGRASHSATAGQIVTVIYGEKEPSIEADEVLITDAGGYYTSDNVEGALQEVGLKNATQDSDISDLQDFDANLTGSQVALVDSGNYYTTDNVEAAFTQLGNHLYDTHLTSDFVSFDHAKRVNLNGSPMSIANFGGIMSSDGGILHLAYNSVAIGTHVVRLANGTPSGTTDQMILTYRPPKRLDYTDVTACLVKLWYTNPHPSDYVTFKGRSSCTGKGLYYNNPLITNSTLTNRPTLGSLVINDFNASSLTFHPEQISFYLEFTVVTSLTTDIYLYGVEFEYPAILH